MPARHSDQSVRDHYGEPITAVSSDRSSLRNVVDIQRIWAFPGRRGLLEVFFVFVFILKRRRQNVRREKINNYFLTLQKLLYLAICDHRGGIYEIN